MATGMTDFKVQQQNMISASGEAESRRFQIAVDRDNRCVWFYTLTDPDPGGHVYVHDPNDEKSDGFAGRTIVFRIGKTGEYHAKGPWHSSSDALYENTGVDLRGKHLTFVVIANYRVYEGCQTVLRDVVYMDDKPTLGEFSRGRELARKWATKLGHPVVVYSESSGGSSNGYEYPEGAESRDWREKIQQVSKGGQW